MGRWNWTYCRLKMSQIEVGKLRAFQYPADQELLLLNIVEQVFDRFQLLGWEQVRLGDQLADEKLFQLSFTLANSFLFLPAPLNFFIQGPG